jgi:ATP-dependent DNA ligase
VVIGWTDPEGSRPFLAAFLLGYYDPGGKLVYAGRVGTGINTAELGRRRRRRPLAVDKMPLEMSPPHSTCFDSPLFLSRVHRSGPSFATSIERQHNAPHKPLNAQIFV